jgi:hypothetical protein
MNTLKTFPIAFPDPAPEGSQRVPPHATPSNPRLVNIDDILDRLESAQFAVEQLRAEGFTVEDVDVRPKRPLIRLRHTRQCGNIPAFLAEIKHGADGDRHVYRARYEGCTLEWTQLGPWAYRRA